MAQFQQWFEQDFTHKIEIRHCESTMFTGDNQGAVIGVHLFNDGAAYSGGGVVTGAVKRSDGGRVVLTGTLSGNAASVVIPEAALAYAGPIGVQIILTSGSQKTTVLKAVYNVDDTSGPAVDPGELVPDIDELLAEIEAMQQATAAANAAAAAANNVDADMTTGTNEATITITNSAGQTKTQTIRAVGIDSIGYITGNEPITDWDVGHYYKTVSGNIDTENKVANSSYQCLLISCAVGDTFTISGKDTGSSAVLYSFIRSNGNVISAAVTNERVTDKVLVAPANSAYLVVNGAVSMTTVVVKNVLQKDYAILDAERYIKNLTYKNGTIISSTGAINAISYRIYSDEYIKLNQAIRIICNSGFQVSIAYYGSDYAYQSVDGFSADTRIIQAGTVFRIVVRRAVEDTSETAAPSVFLPGFSVYVYPYAVIGDLATQNPLTGKTMNVIGDSYVAGNTLGASSTWHYKLAQKYGMTYNNYGINGTGLVAYRQQYGDPVVSRYSDMTNDADIVIVIGGKNDYNEQLSISDFEAGLETLCTGLVSKYIGKTICFFTPWNVPQSVLEAIGNGGSIPLVDYVASIEKICHKYSIAVYKTDVSGVYMFNSAFRSAYCQGTNDVSHLNNAGSELFLPRAEAFLETLI